MQHHLLDNDRNLRCQKRQHFEIVIRVGVKLVALQIENTDDFRVRNDRRDHFRLRPRPRIDVTTVLTYVMRHVRLASHGHVTNQAFAHLQMKFLQVVDVITAHGLRMKDAGFIRLSVPLSQRLRTLDQINARCVVWN